MTQVQPALAELTLLDWKRDVFALYARIRDLPPHEGWQMWRREREHCGSRDADDAARL